MIWRWFWREWRSPSLLIVWLALTLSVACVLALGNISNRIEQSLNQQSRDVLAGDRVLRGTYPIDQQWLDIAQQKGLTISQQISFMTMSYANDRPLLTSVKATDDLYPLYGELETNPPNLNAKPGTVLVSPRLLNLLNITVGQSIDVGDATLIIAGELLQEPDAGFNPFQTAPRILINLQDVEKTGAIQPGSRLTYRDMFTGSAQAIAQFSQYVHPQLRSDQRWYSVDDTDSAVSNSLNRAKKFLVLSGLLTLLLATSAIVVSMNHYCRSRYDLIAVLKTLGAGKKALRHLIIGQWLSVLILAAISGIGLGLLFEFGLIQLLQPVLPTKLPSAGYQPLLWSLALLLFIALLIGMRPYKQLLATQPIRVLRQDILSNVWPLRFYIPIVVIIVTALLFSLVGFNKIWWLLLLGIVVLALLLGVIAWTGLFILRRLTIQKLSLRLAVNRLLRQPLSTLSQLSTFSLSFMLLALLLMLRGDLIGRWQQQLPPDSPNYFLLNINDQQLSKVKEFLVQHQLHAESFYPVVRVRLTKIDDQPINQLIKEDSAGYEAINRELNLTWLDQQEIENPIISGQWPPKTGEVSIEQGVAERLGVTLGTKLTFTGDTIPFSAVISSIRQVDWQNLRPNFYFIFPQDGLKGQPQSWLTSFHYQGDGQVLTDFNRQFPTVGLLDIGNMLNQITQILQQVSKALEVMVVLVLFCGFLLLLAQIQVGMQQRKQELMVYRILGASKRLLRYTLWNEFALLGLASGIAATIGTEIALGLLQSKVFDFSWQPNYWLWLLLPIISSLLLSLCGGWLGQTTIKNK